MRMASNAGLPAAGLRRREPSQPGGRCRSRNSTTGAGRKRRGDSQADHVAVTHDPKWPLITLTAHSVEGGGALAGFLSPRLPPFLFRGGTVRPAFGIGLGSRMRLSSSLDCSFQVLTPSVPTFWAMVPPFRCVQDFLENILDIVPKPSYELFHLKKRQILKLGAGFYPLFSFYACEGPSQCIAPRRAFEF